MALWDEVLEGNLIGIAVLGGAAVVAGRMAPSLRPALESAVELFVESEFELRDGFLKELVDATVDALFEALDGPAPDAQKREQARNVIEKFEKKAKTSAHRHGWNGRDRAARYRHHIRKLKAAISHRALELRPGQLGYVLQLGDSISEQLPA
jgi:hypothetical protein